jgi:hypothetical protein
MQQCANRFAQTGERYAGKPRLHSFYLPRQDSHVQIALSRQVNAMPETRGSFLYTC